jgi:hypothetical protein
MMRRKKKPDPNAVVVVDPNAIPGRPKGLNEARDALQKELGYNVGSGYGFGPKAFSTDNADTPRGEEHAWRLYAFCDETITIPPEFKGFQVVRRSVPVSLAGPPWGKIAQRMGLKR